MRWLDGISDSMVMGLSKLQWLSDAVGVDRGRERERAGQAGTWQAGNKFCFRAKSSQPAKHSTAGSFIGDP